MNRIASIKANTLVLNGMALAIAPVLFLFVVKWLWNVQVPEKKVAVVFFWSVFQEYKYPSRSVMMDQGVENGGIHE